MARSISSSRQKPKLVTAQQIQDDSDIPKVVTAKSKVTINHLCSFKPLTQNQQKVFESFKNDRHIVLDGCPGTGKTMCALYLSLYDILALKKYKHVVIIKSITPTKNIGFLPGSLEEKIAVYEQPYKDLCKELFIQEVHTPYEKLQEQKILQFMSTSFLRGATINDSIVIIDESQNLNFQEACSAITRIGRNSKLILCGDYFQSDLEKDSEKRGYLDVKKILKNMPSVDFVEFGIEDIVRSSFVADFIKSKIKLGFQ